MKEHRLYLYMSEPIRFLGFTLFELTLSVGGLIGSLLNTGNLTLQTIYLSFGWGSVIALRRIKKFKIGMNLKSFLTFYGVLPSHSPHWPPFHKRMWLP